MSEKPAEGICSTCQQSLGDCVTTEKDGGVFKSCLSCSSKAGTHDFL